MLGNSRSLWAALSPWKRLKRRWRSSRRELRQAKLASLSTDCEVAVGCTTAFYSAQGFGKAIHEEGSMPAIQDSRSPVEAREPVRYLVFSASLRAESLNSQLARLTASTIEQHNGIVDWAAMKDFDAPSYDQDMQDSKGFPP